MMSKNKFTHNSVLGEIYLEHEALKNINPKKIDINMYGSPHLLIDSFFGKSIYNLIECMWPESSNFEPEVKGSCHFGLFNHKINSLVDSKAEFWGLFNEYLSPVIISKIAQIYYPLLSKIFGDELLLEGEGITTHGPVLLMEQGPEYEGIRTHHHFYHNPNWVFTILIYVGDDSGINPGTTLIYLEDNDKIDDKLNSYREFKNISNDLLKESIYVLHREQYILNSNFNHKSSIINYKGNRLFSFIDGPLALHKVECPTSNGCDKRRLIRAHIKINLNEYFDRLQLNFSPEKFVHIMSPENIKNTNFNNINTDIINFYKNIISNYYDSVNDFELFDTKINSDILSQILYSNIKKSLY